MDLENLKETWKATETLLPKNQSLNPETLKAMTKQHYRSKMNRIMIPELLGSIVCMTAAFCLVLRFYNFDSYLLQAAGVLSILLLLLIPIISSVSTWKFYNAGDMTKTYSETVRLFAVQKIKFLKLQKINVTLCYLLSVCVIVLLSKLFGGMDISGTKYYWLFSFTVGFILLLFYSKWVEKYYRKGLVQAEELLQELTD